MNDINLNSKEINDYKLEKKDNKDNKDDIIKNYEIDEENSLKVNKFLGKIHYFIKSLQLSKRSKFLMTKTNFTMFLICLLTTVLFYSIEIDNLNKDNPSKTNIDNNLNGVNKQANNTLNITETIHYDNDINNSSIETISINIINLEKDIVQLQNIYFYLSIFFFLSVCFDTVELYFHKNVVYNLLSTIVSLSATIVNLFVEFFYFFSITYNIYNIYHYKLNYEIDVIIKIWISFVSFTLFSYLYTIIHFINNS